MSLLVKNNIREGGETMIGENMNSVEGNARKSASNAADKLSARAAMARGLRALDARTDQLHPLVRAGWCKHQVRASTA